MNKVILGGCLTSSIKEIPTSTGTKMCTFSLAVRRKGDKSKMDKDTDFFNCVCFSSTANYLLNYCHKGDYVEVVGSIQNTKYMKDGVERTSTQIRVDDLDRIRVAKGNEGMSYGDGYQNNQDSPTPYESNPSSYTGYPNIEEDDDLPF